MRKIILAFLLILCVASTSRAVDFVEIIKDDNFLIYIDADSMQKEGDYWTFWTKWIPRGEQLKLINKTKNKKVSHIMQFSAFKIKIPQRQLLAEYYYYKNGEYEKNFASEFIYNGWQEVPPESYAKLFWEIIKVIDKKF